MAKKAAKSPARRERGTPDNLTGSIVPKQQKPRLLRRRIVFEVDVDCSKERFNVRAVEMARRFIDDGETAVLLTTEDIDA